MPNRQLPYLSEDIFVLIFPFRVVKLTQNFRSHSAILKFPNERFYKGDLQPCADPNSVGMFIGSDHLEAKDFPIVFHAMTGHDDREASSPSFFNIDEVSQVKATVEELLGDSRLKLSKYYLFSYRLTSNGPFSC